jgi:hypothetical protein
MNPLDTPDDQQSADRLLGLHRKFAITRHPELAAFDELLVGNSLDEVLASADSLSQRLATPAQPSQDVARQAARQAYGSPASGGGGMPMLSADQRVRDVLSQAARHQRHHPQRPRRGGPSADEIEDAIGQAGGDVVRAAISSNGGFPGPGR